ncbi:hypothetical protein B0H10DRAFT_2015542, partial [Mycena sp. CBHHK59/15]
MTAREGGVCVHLYSRIHHWAGFQSSALATYAPKLYRYYCTILKALFDHHPGLVHTFSNSVFPAVTFNLGPA